MPASWCIPGWVACRSVGECGVTHNLSEGGLVRLDLKFYPANPLKFPVSTLNTRRQLLGASESLLDSALRRYRSVMATVDAVRINIQALRSALSGVFATIQRQFTPFMTIYSDVTALVHSLVNAPLTVSTLFTTFFASFDGDSRRARRANGTSSIGGASTGTNAGSGSGSSTGAVQAAVPRVAVTAPLRVARQQGPAAMAACPLLKRSITGR